MRARHTCGRLVGERDAQSSSAKLNAIHLANGRTRRVRVGKVAKPKALGLPALAISDNAETGDGSNHRELGSHGHLGRVVRNVSDWGEKKKTGKNSRLKIWYRALFIYECGNR